MAVILETSVGDLVVDLYVDDCPMASKNFLKLCKIKYYNNCLFHTVQPDFIAQAGDPTNTGRGGESIFGVLYGDHAKHFDDEIRPQLRHKRKGLLGMASLTKNGNGSQFYVTLAPNLSSLDEKHTIFGEVAEGLDCLERMNEAPLDQDGHPLQHIRIRHTVILDDPFDDPSGLEEKVPEGSPEPVFDARDRLEDDWAPEEDTRPAEEVEEETRRHEAKSRAVVLEMIGDLPDADVKPPSTHLFICKLNPVTTEEDLEIIFSRFGKVTDCSIVRDIKTGASLNYGFIGFEEERSAEEAYFKMNNCLIDDRRVKVDFSQSVAKLWSQFKRLKGKGDMSMAQEASNHERKEGGAGAWKNIELKQPLSHGAGQGGHRLLLGISDGGDGYEPRGRRKDGGWEGRERERERGGRDRRDRDRDDGRDREWRDERRDRDRDDGRDGERDGRDERRDRDRDDGRDRERDGRDERRDRDRGRGRDRRDGRRDRDRERGRDGRDDRRDRDRERYRDRGDRERDFGRDRNGDRGRGERGDSGRRRERSRSR